MVVVPANARCRTVRGKLTLKAYLHVVQINPGNRVALQDYLRPLAPTSIRGGVDWPAVMLQFCEVRSPNCAILSRGNPRLIAAETLGDL